MKMWKNCFNCAEYLGNW